MKRWEGVINRARTKDRRETTKNYRSKTSSIMWQSRIGMIFVACDCQTAKIVMIVKDCSVLVRGKLWKTREMVGGGGKR